MPETEHPKESSTDQPMKILIADDDHSSLLILKKILGGKEYELITATNGDQAWKLLQQPEHPKLLLLDWMMPGLTGIEIIQRLRQREDGSSFYMIVLTSLDSPDDAVFALDEGADEFITKPYHADSLRARINVGRRVLLLRDMLEENIRQLEDANRIISKLAATDELTKLYNRRHFNKHLKDTISAAMRHEFSLSLILADIDEFKTINDNHGHDMGDRMLKIIASTIKEVSRAEDIPARWGGEEFILSLPHTPLSGAQILAERLRQKFTLNCQQQTGLKVTASFGVTEFQPNENPEVFIKRADKALYRAKRKGRDRVICG